MSQSCALPFQNTYWVLPGRLLAGPYPGHWRPEDANQRLRALASCKIQQVINLMEAEEVDHQGRPFVPYIDTLRAFSDEASRQVQWQRFAIQDGGIPSRADMRHILNAIDSALAVDRPVYLHCWGGKGRTGTVVGCYLVRHGLAAGPQALARIAELRRAIQPPQPSPETEAQCQMVLSWNTGE